MDPQTYKEYLRNFHPPRQSDPKELSKLYLSMQYTFLSQNQETRDIKNTDFVKLIIV